MAGIKKILVTLDGCKHCASALTALKNKITTKEIEVQDLNDVYADLEDISCLKTLGGYPVPQLALVEDNKIIQCGVFGTTKAAEIIESG